MRLEKSLLRKCTHRLHGRIITVEQMALLEPGLAETFLGAVMFTMREAMDEVIKMGVPKDAVFDFFMGHINIDLALCFDQIPGGVFSDACYKAIKIGKPLIFKEDWKKVLDPEHVKYQVSEMTKIAPIQKS